MFSESNPTKDVAEGVTKAVINATKDEIKGWVYKLKNRDLLFIGKKETIELIKKERETAEWDLFDKYIKDKKIRVLVQIGLTLRKLEDNPEEIKRLQEIISQTHGGWGIHIAHFVQTGFLTNYIGTIIKKYISQKALKEDLEHTLRNVEKYVIFIKSFDEVERQANIIKQRIEVDLPKVLILYSLKSAVKIAKQIKDFLEKEIQNYDIEETILQGERYICFFLRDDDYWKEEMGYLK